MSAAEQARRRALAALRAAGGATAATDAALRRAWDHLEADFGWPRASRAWREARAELAGEEVTP